MRIRAPVFPVALALRITVLSYSDTLEELHLAPGSIEVDPKGPSRAVPAPSDIDTIQVREGVASEWRQEAALSQAISRLTIAAPLTRCARFDVEQSQLQGSWFTAFALGLDERRVLIGLRETISDVPPVTVFALALWDEDAARVRDVRPEQDGGWRFIGSRAPIAAHRSSCSRWRFRIDSCASTLPATSRWLIASPTVILAETPAASSGSLPAKLTPLGRRRIWCTCFCRTWRSNHRPLQRRKTGSLRCETSTVLVW